MALRSRKIKYFLNGRAKIINVKVCDTVWSKFSGLMFRRESEPLFFVFDKINTFSIHSFFCSPFRAIWLDDKMKSTKVVDVKNWTPSITGRGKYLLEIPLSFDNGKFVDGN